MPCNITAPILDDSAALVLWYRDDIASPIYTVAATLPTAWLTVDADPAIIFDTPAEQRYQRALSLLGIDPAFLAQEAGHA